MKATENPLRKGYHIKPLHFIPIGDGYWKTITGYGQDYAIKHQPNNRERPYKLIKWVDSPVEYLTDEESFERATKIAQNDFDRHILRTIAQE